MVKHRESEECDEPILPTFDRYHRRRPLPDPGHLPGEPPLPYNNHRLFQLLILTLCLIATLVIIIRRSRCPTYYSYNDKIYDKSSMPEEIRWGHLGEKVQINTFNLSRQHYKELQDGVERYGYNAFVSSRISLRRHLPDTQSSLCRSLWPNLNRKASVVIVYHNEAWSVLMRTIYSVLDRSESYLLHEVVIVDDGSTNRDVAGIILKNYLSIYHPKIKVIQYPARKGLWRARLAGAEQASGDVIVFLHPRCECRHGWLRTLVGGLEGRSKVIAVPVVDTIDPFTFEYQMKESVQNIRVGTFTWYMEKVIRPPNGEYTQEDNLIPTPIISDGILALTKTFLVQSLLDSIHSVDKAIDNSNNTNSGDITSLQDIALSFGTWMCGGSIEIAPCSHVGLVDRNPSHRSTSSERDFNRNSLKAALAEGWMDEFKGHVLDRIRGSHQSLNDGATIVDKIGSMRQRLGCHPFSWYLANVETSLEIPPRSSRRGEIIHTGVTDLPLVVGRNGSNLALYQWETRPRVFIWYFTMTSLLATDDNMCLSVSLASGRVLLRPCDTFETVFLLDTWTLTKNGFLLHRKTQLCLSLHNTEGENLDILKMESCDITKSSQKWNLLLS